MKASLKTSTLEEADKERDDCYRSFKKVVDGFAEMPVADLREAGLKLQQVVNNYRLRTSENYMKETGNMENLLQDLEPLRSEVRRLTLYQVVDQMKAANLRVREMLTGRNAERTERELGELKAAREATDKARLEVITLLNALLVVEADNEKVRKLAKLLTEDYDYFRKHAIGKRTRKSADPEPTDTPATETPAAEG